MRAYREYAVRVHVMLTVADIALVACARFMPHGSNMLSEDTMVSRFLFDVGGVLAGILTLSGVLLEFASKPGEPRRLLFVATVISTWVFCTWAMTSEAST